MATSEWKQPIMKHPADRLQVAHFSLYNARKFFAMDTSGSTRGRIVGKEWAFVKGLHTNREDTVAKWNHNCQTPQLVDETRQNYLDDVGGGTSPDQILRNASAVREIKRSDVWFLLTDGEIPNGAVAELTNLADKLDLTHIPMVLLIVGRKRSLGPAVTNISVGIPFFANSQESLILFKDDLTGEIFVIAAKGSFASLLYATDESLLADLTDWDSLPMYHNESEFAHRCGELGIKFIPQEDRRITKALSLGPNWDSTTQSLVDVTKLLAQTVVEQSDLSNLLEYEAFHRLLIICKTRDRLRPLRRLLEKQKQPEVVVRFEDCHGASNILEAMQNSLLSLQESNKMREQLREAHAANRATYLHALDSRSKEAQRVKDLNRLIDRALASLKRMENSAYTAEILSQKSNRARRAKIANAGDAEFHIVYVDLSNSVDAFRDTCLICCEENQIMSIALKNLDSVGENTSDFAVNFPLAAVQSSKNAEMISSQCICFQCALFCRKSIFNENLSAILPTTGYMNANKVYINHQLTLAITGGLCTGIAGITQLFMTILDQTIETKAWCSDQSHLEDIEQDLETSMRRRGLKWMLENLLRNVVTPENFAPSGPLVKYPEALRWVAADFNERQLDSWIIQYPVAGFSQMLRWYDILQLELPPDLPDAMLTVKLIHFMVSIITTERLWHENGGDLWKYRSRYLKFIYKAFNAKLVPKDQGSASILEPIKFWSRLEAKLEKRVRSAAKCFLSKFAPALMEKVTYRVQLILFWALYYHKEHTTPKAFFQKIQLEEPLAQAVLDPAAVIQESTVREILCSIFCPPKPSSMILHSDSPPPPFASPFGPSVLQCGIAGCGVKFYTDLSAASLNADAIRQRRAEHLKTSYGITPEFNASQTGLPDFTEAPVPPSSTHYNLHAGIVRVWCCLPHRVVTNRFQVGYPFKEDVISGLETAVTSFIDEVRTDIAIIENRRGNVYCGDVDKSARCVLPSFIEALRVASVKRGLEDCSGASYIYETATPSYATKIEYELSLRD